MAKNKPRKVLFLITKATWGGAQKYVYDLATNLPKDQFESVVAYGQTGLLADDLIAAGIRTVQLPSLGRDVAIISDIKSFLEMLQCLRAERADVVHLSSSKAAALGALAARICGIKKIIFTVHGWPFREPRNAVSRAAIWLISWLTALLSHKVICVSDYDLRLAQQMPSIGRKAVRIYNGIVPYMELGSGAKIRTAFPAGVKITGAVGELTYNKNHIALIEQAKQHSDTYVAIVGEGELREVLEQKIKEYGLGDRVKLFGFMPANEVLKGFDTFALPSLKEGLPYVLLEAKAAGLPIAASRVGGVGEILDNDVSVFGLDRMVRETILLYKRA